MSELSSVAFDIETTGFATDDTLTVVGFDLELGSRVFLNTAGRERPPALAQQLTDTVDWSVSLSAHNTESELLRAVAEFADATLRGRDVKLVAYNGERWNGGFDLPFLRTRLSRHGAEWPFVDLPYVDAMDIFETYFNTSEDTLETVYEELIGDVEAILGREESMRLKLLRESIDRTPPIPELEEDLPDDEVFYDGEVSEWTDSNPSDSDDESRA